MQIHLKDGVVALGAPYLNEASRTKPFVTVPVGPVRLLIENEADAEQLIAIGCQAKDMLRDAKLTDDVYRLPAGELGWDEPLPDGAS
jgi:hypothetical protein